jgi:hypothetical protein
VGSRGHEAGAAVLYPVTMRSYDRIAWNEPWFMVLNYLALGMTWLWLLNRRDRQTVSGH